jgi:hypothetical protein
MKRTIIGCTIIATVALLGALPSAQAATRHARIPSCLARQRAMLTPLDRYGGYAPPNAPALVQQLVNPMLDAVRTRCYPVYRDRPVFNPVTNSYE